MSTKQPPRPKQALNKGFMDLCGVHRDEKESNWNLVLKVDQVNLKISQ